MASIVIVCPECSKSSRTTRVLQPGQKVRCGDCGFVSRVFIHGNGAVELRPPAAPEATMLHVGMLPPRVDGGRRPAIRANRTERPRGGYAPFEWAREWIGSVAVIAAIGVGGFSAYWYIGQIRDIQNTTGTIGGRNAFRSDIDAKRADYLKRQEKALARLKARTK